MSPEVEISSRNGTKKVAVKMRGLLQVHVVKNDHITLEMPNSESDTRMRRARDQFHNLYGRFGVRVTADLAGETRVNGVVLPVGESIEVTNAQINING